MIRRIAPFLLGIAAAILAAWAFGSGRRSGHGSRGARSEQLAAHRDRVRRRARESLGCFGERGDDAGGAQ